MKIITVLCQYLNYFNASNSYYCKLIKDFLIENQMHNKKIKITDNNNDKTEQYLNNQTLTFHNKSNLQKIKIENLNKPPLVETLKQKEIFESKMKTKFLPLILSTRTYNDKKEIIWYISNINKRLNIINILNTLEQIHKMKREFLDQFINNKDNSLSFLNDYKIMKNNFFNDRGLTRANLNN